MVVVKTATLTKHCEFEKFPNTHQFSLSGKSNSSPNFSISFYKFHSKQHISLSTSKVKEEKERERERERVSPGANWLAYTFFPNLGKANR